MLQGANEWQFGFQFSEAKWSKVQRTGSILGKILDSFGSQKMAVSRQLFGDFGVPCGSVIVLVASPVRVTGKLALRFTSARRQKQS